MRIHLIHKSLKLCVFYEIIDFFIKVNFQQTQYSLSNFISSSIVQSMVFQEQPKIELKNISLVPIPNQSFTQVLKYIESSKDYCLKI